MTDQTGITTEKAWSMDGESYGKCLYDVLDDYFANDDLERPIPETVEVFEGDCVQPKASEFFNGSDGVLDDMAEYAFDQCGEWSEDWLADVKPEHSKKLNERIKAVLDAWATEHGYQPKWLNCENVRKVTVNIDEVMGKEWRNGKD
jgi:hypothetical protein